jgi:MoaA/NifB/PqqE/SkfB family radical SAM enzyme
VTTNFLWLEITGRCQLQCGHCYNSSGPDGTSGAMTTDDWRKVITDAAAAGVGMVQFIGGEPTLHPDLPGLIRYALDAGLRVEVYTNLVHVRPDVWEAFELPGVSLATSFYTDNRAQHQQITGRDTLRQTTANIELAVLYDIPIRVGMVRILDDQRVEAAAALLERLGVTSISIDRERKLGRAGNGGTSELCGHCGDGTAAVLPDGSIAPCPMSRATTVGSVLTGRLVETLGAPMAAASASIRAHVGEITGKCEPFKSDCNPPCGPEFCQPSQLCTPNR